MSLFRIFLFIMFSFNLSATVWSSEANEELVKLSSLKVTNPPIYRITSSDGQSAFLFGTMHNVPMTAFSEKTKAFLLSHGVFVTESIDYINYDALPSGFVEFSDEQKAEIHSTQLLIDDNLMERIKSVYNSSRKADLIQPLSSQRKVNFEKITPYFICAMANAEEEHSGVDWTLQQKYLKKLGKSGVYGLENFSDAILLEDQDEISRQNTQEGREALIAEAKKIFARIDQGLIEWDFEDGQYLLGILGKVNDPVIIKRNQEWLPEMLKIVAEYNKKTLEHDKKSILFAVGADHIYGLFKLLIGKSFSFELYDPNTDTYAPFSFEKG